MINNCMFNVIAVAPFSQRNSSLKSENSVIIYSPSCRFKPVLLTFFSGTQKEKKHLITQQAALVHAVAMNGNRSLQASNIEQIHKKSVLNVVHSTHVLYS